MSRFVRATAAVALLAGAGVALTASGSAGAATKPLQDFSAIAKVTHISQHGDNTGIFRERLKSNGRKIGTSKLKCRFTKKAVNCSGTWHLDAGVIKARGQLADGAGISALRIKRGTRLYEGARGAVLLEQVTERRNRETFDFDQHQQIDR